MILVNSVLILFLKVFGIKKGKESKEALRIADDVLIALLKGNNLDINSIFEKDGSIKEAIKIGDDSDWDSVKKFLRYNFSVKDD